MLQDDDEAVKLKHAEEVGFVIVPRVDQAAEVVQTSEEPLDLQAAAIAPRFAMVLGSPLRRLGSFGVISRIRYFA